ncbi:MAG: hypothetical protein KKB21_05070 [Nanoarchaeota archaeon]|nr:hypothetical protein [Nanoarchaeota archaeon]MBU4086917.1 hypothetical protein [Nanoarchaeota archaeon]
MANTFPGIFTLELFVCSVIFIIAADLLQNLSRMYKWKSFFLITTKNIFAYLSMLSILSSVSMYIVLRPF